MKCLILAAGYATRLYPLTENFPKPLLTVGKKTILDWLIDDIDTLGTVDEYVVISNHKFAHHFEEWAKFKNQKVTVLDDGTDSNENRLGAVKDIQFAIDSLNIKDAWDHIKNSCTVVYLQESYIPFSEYENENKVNELVFEDRDIFLKQKSDILVKNLNNEENCLSLIFEEMKKYFNLC